MPAEREGLDGCIWTLYQPPGSLTSQRTFQHNQRRFDTVCPDQSSMESPIGMVEESGSMRNIWDRGGVS